MIELGRKREEEVEKDAEKQELNRRMTEDGGPNDLGMDGWSRGREGGGGEGRRRRGQGQEGGGEDRGCMVGALKCKVKRNRALNGQSLPAVEKFK